jgi:ribosomal protein S1
MQDLMIQINTLKNKLNLAIKELKTRGINKAKAEAEYRTALAEKILIERDKGTPVTIVNDVCRGDRKIAKLKMERDIAETLYESCLQAIYATKLEMNIINDMMIAERKGE